MRTLGLTLLSLVAACRFGFDPQAPIDAADAVVDAPPDTPPPPPDAPTVLGCAPVRFAIGGVTKFVTAVGTPRGYDVFAVDDTGAVRGYAYRFVMDKLELVPGTGNVLPVPAAIGPVGALALDDDPRDEVDVVIAVPYAIPATISGVATVASGTVVIPLNAQLERVDMPVMATMNDGLEAGPGALAGGERGTVAFVGRNSDGTLGLQPVSRAGIAPGGSHTVDTDGHTISRPTMVRAATGYLAVWGDNDAMPHEGISAALINDSFVAQPAINIHIDPAHGSFVPAAAYSTGSRKYLFGWMEKPGRDLIKLTLRNEQLADAPGPIDIMQDGTVPVIVAGDSDFLVVWADTSSGPKQRLGAARVAPDGSFLLRGITNTGGDAVAFDVVVHNGQPALFWVEKGGSGPNLWVDALCL